MAGLHETHDQQGSELSGCLMVCLAIPWLIGMEQIFSMLNRLFVSFFTGP